MYSALARYHDKQIKSRSALEGAHDKEKQLNDNQDPEPNSELNGILTHVNHQARLARAACARP